MRSSVFLDRAAVRRAAARGLGMAAEAIDLDALLADRDAIVRAGHALHRAHLADPAALEPLCGLAHLLIAAGEMESAGTFAGRALRLAPGHAESYALLGLTAALRRLWSTAACFALIAASLAPDDDAAAALFAHACRADDGAPPTTPPVPPAPSPLVSLCPGSGDDAGPPDVLLLRGLDENVLLSAYRNASGRRGLAIDMDALCRRRDTNHVYRTVLEIIGHVRPRLLCVQAGGITRRDELPAELLLAAREAHGCQVVMLYSDASKPFFHDAHRRIYTPAVDLMVAIDAGFPPALCGPTVVNAWTPVDSAQFFPGDGERPVDVAFSGTRRRHYGYRDRMLNHLATQGIAVAVSGEGNPRPTRDAYAAALRQAKIVVNFSRAPTLPVESLSGGPDATVHLKGRVLEALASGCLLLEEDNPVTARFLTPGVHYVPFDGADDLLAKVRHYLAHPAEREAIARAGHAAWAARYTEAAFWDLVRTGLAAAGLRCGAGAPTRPCLPGVPHGAGIP